MVIVLTRQQRKQVAMEPNQCPLCKNRVSDWMMATGKTTIIDGKVVHNSCMIDYELRNGKKYVAEKVS